MPKPSDYTPTRRYVMQAVMIVILGATIALAAAVGASARRAARVELSPEPVAANDVSVRLPVGWRTRPLANRPGIVVQAIENGEGAGAEDDNDRRTVTVRTERLDAPYSPLEYLLRQFELPAGGGDGDGDGGGGGGGGPRSRSRERHGVDEPPATVPTAGRTGVMMTMLHGPGRRGGGLRKQVVAAVVLPSQRGIVVHLEGAGDADVSDRAIVRQIAGAIRVANESELGRPGDIVVLADGIRFKAPRQLAPVAETDPNRTGRRLWPVAATRNEVDEIERGWLAVETVGCLSPDFDPADPEQLERARQTLATLLLVRDTSWRGATITPLGGKVWRADVAGPANGGSFSPARAYLKTDPSGRALLAVFRRGFGQADFDPVWSELAASVEFVPAADVASLEDVGTAEASRLRREGYEDLLADRDVEWWLWTSHDAHVGWSTIDFPGNNGLVGRKELRLRVLGGDRVSRLTHDFSYRDAGPQYQSTVSRLVTGGARDAPWVQRTTLDDGQLAMFFTEGVAAEPRHVWRPAAPPPQFVPGALLPLVLGNLSREPMLLLTDSFPGREGIAPPQPIGVIIRPGENKTRTAEGETAPMRCVTAQVNGADTISRWYFRKSGELQSVDWSAGVQQVASDQKVVQNNFPKDDEMAP